MTSADIFGQPDPPRQVRRVRRGVVRKFGGRGVILDSPMPAPVGPRNPVGGPRGSIRSWSSASRRRLRRALMLLGAPEGWVTAGMTFTIPGPVLPAREMRDLWASFCREVEEAGAGMIWRAEVQERGALHWHGVVIQSAALLRSSAGQPEASAEWCALRSVRELVGLWWAEIEGLGPFAFDPPYESGRGRQKFISVSSLMQLPGAVEHAAQGEVADAWSGRWLRYLQEHASKRKQEQLGENIGRHWGIVGRRRFVRCRMSGAEELNVDEIGRAHV